MNSLGQNWCVSADSHVIEPADLFVPLEKRFGSEAPRIKVVEGRGVVLDLGNGEIGELRVGGFLTVNVDFSKPEAQEIAKKGYELARPGVYNIKARLEDQDLDGVKGEILYPSILMNVYQQLKNVEIIRAIFASYNDWLSDYCSEARDRLFPLACLQLYDIPKAVMEMERAKKIGHVGVCLPATAPVDRPYTDRAYDQLWAAAQDMEMPCTMHSFTSSTGVAGVSKHQGRVNGALAFTGVMFTIADLILSGVVERFPRLRFVPTEFGTGWVAIMLKRLDRIYERGGGKQKLGISMKPSEYWRRNFRVTFEDDIIGIRTRDIIHTETMMWGSDYPHGDSVFPNSQEVLNTILESCSREERLNLTSRNVAQLYKLPHLSKLPLAV